jgi:hypothetical protein
VEHLRGAAQPARLAALGCAFIVSAVESLSDTVLAHLDKGYCRTDVAERSVPSRRRDPTAPDLGGVHAVDDTGRRREMLDFAEAEG